MPIYLGGGQRLFCWLCRWKPGGQGKSRLLPKTKWECKPRTVSLYLNDQRNCFMS